MDTATNLAEQAKMDARTSAEKSLQENEEEEKAWKIEHAKELAEINASGREDALQRSAAARRNTELHPGAAAKAPSTVPDQTPPVAPAVSPTAPAVAPTVAPAAAPTAPPAPAPTAAAAPAATSADTTSETTPPSAPPTKEESTTGKIKEFFKTLLTSAFGGKMPDWLSKLFDDKKTTQVTEASSSGDSVPVPSPAPATDQIKQDTVAEKADVNDSTRGLRGDALLNNPQFKARAQQIANRIGVSVSDLYAIFKMEGVSRNPITKKMDVDPAAVNSTSGASGLIQWMPRYAPKGTTIEEIRKMSGLEQLDYVEKHFMGYAGKIHSFADLYRAVFYPASIGRPESFIFGSESKDPNYRHAVARQNSGIAKASGRPDGLIDNAGFERYANRQRPSDSGLV